MLIKPRKFMRKPFYVEAVEVTADNMTEVAQWCRGQLRTSVGRNGRGRQRYIKVDVKRPLTPRQTQAYVGDWVVTSSDQNIRGFKVYTPVAFGLSFDEVVEHMLDTVQKMQDRADEEEHVEQEEIMFPEELRLSDPVR